jgi:DNA polymerase-3 subunit delta'
MKMRLHPAAEAQVNALIQRPRGTALLHGPRGVGKRTTALEVARQLNCEGCSDGSCHACRMAAGGNHPNIIVVGPDEKGKIGVEAVHELQHALYYQQYERRGWRVVVLAEAETLTLPAQSALLKTLEEPPAGTLIILTSETPQALLPTVLSRCVLIFTPALPLPAIEAFVREAYPQADAAAIAASSRGLIGRAIEHASNPGLLEQDQQLAAEVGELLGATGGFERLQLAGRMAARADQRSAYLSELALQTHTAARRAVGGAGSVGALERLHQRLWANVNPKTAFEAFALELA